MSFSGFSDEITADEIVENEEFWPDINLLEFQEQYRLPAQYRKEMLVDRIRLAMLWANKTLAEWKAGNAGDAVSLLDVPSKMLGSEHALKLQYVRAVCCEAKAILLSDYKTMMRKSDAVSDAKEERETADQFHQYASDAINDFMGNSRIFCELL
jgi:hypothetical protein